MRKAKSKGKGSFLAQLNVQVRPQITDALKSRTLKLSMDTPIKPLSPVAGSCTPGKFKFPKDPDRVPTPPPPPKFANSQNTKLETTAKEISGILPQQTSSPIYTNGLEHQETTTTQKIAPDATSPFPAPNPANLSTFLTNSSPTNLPEGKTPSLYIESRLKDLNERSKSKYIHRKIQKSLDFMQIYKKTIKTPNLHSQFKFILGQDAKKSIIGDFSNMRSMEHLEGKWSSLSGVCCGDLRLSEHLDVEALGRKIEKRLQPIERSEMKAQRLVHLEEMMAKGWAPKGNSDLGENCFDRKSSLILENRAAQKHVFDRNLEEKFETVLGQVKDLSLMNVGERFEDKVRIKHRTWESIWKTD
jgi:hypothetical protein